MSDLKKLFKMGALGTIMGMDDDEDDDTVEEPEIATQRPTRKQTTQPRRDARKSTMLT